MIYQLECGVRIVAFLVLTGFVGFTEAGETNTAMTGFKKRVDGMFRAEAGKPLKRASKNPPLQPGRGNYTRAYSFSIVWFASRWLYLDEMIAEANAALVENAQHYLDNPKDIHDRDSFHWHSDIVMRLIDMYGSKGTARAGRITPETEALCLKPIWEYVRVSSSLAKADHEKSGTWDIYSTENHHAMDFTVDWQFAKIAKDRPEYRDRKLADGSTLADQYRAWNSYIVAYFRERAKKGPSIEIMCPGYNCVWLKGIYNFRDFGDPGVRHSAEMFLDLYWAYWSQEQLNGIEGGGKARIRGVNGFSAGSHGIPALGWLYFVIGQKPSGFGAEINAMLSDYEPPEVVADIAHNSRVDGPYEVRQRAQGLGKQGSDNPVMAKGNVPNRFRKDGGGIVRYSYNDPAFTIGTLMTEARPLEDWVHISAQSRWQGVIFSNNRSARIVPIVLPTGKARDVLNGQWSVQSKGCLITQKLEGNKGGGPMIVWMPEEGMAAPEREGNLVFVETEGAYSAIRVAGSDFTITGKKVSNRSLDGSERVAPPGNIILPKDEYAPVILEVVAKSRIADFADFKKRAKACELKLNGPVLSYRSLYGDLLTLDTSYKMTPTINGKPVDYSPPSVLESPFLNSVYDSGVVTIRKGDHVKVLDFD